jgi:hypothetical protein
MLAAVKPPLPATVVGPMSTRTFLMLTGGAIVLLSALLLADRYRQCLATHPGGPCPEAGPYISRSGGLGGLQIAPSTAPGR